MRSVTGRKGITFDTITMDGELEEEIEVLTNDRGEGLYFFPVAIRETVIGSGSIYETAGPVEINNTMIGDPNNSTSPPELGGSGFGSGGLGGFGGGTGESAIIGQLSPIRATFFTELRLGFGGENMPSAGGLGAGVISVDNPRMEVTQQP